MKLHPESLSRGNWTEDQGAVISSAEDKTLLQRLQVRDVSIVVMKRNPEPVFWFQD